jgi:hypothetical protein
VEVDNVVEKVWGNSKEWFLELRDGKRLRLSEGLRNLTPAVDDSISQRVLQWVEEQGLGWSVCTEEENTGAGSETELAMVEKIMSEESEEPLMVKPLAVVIPQELEDVREQQWKPSDRVMKMLKGFRKLVEASYEGYEDKVIDLLVAIDARRQQGVSGSRRSINYGKRGSRELKGLISIVNYEHKESNSKGGALLLTNEC